MVITPKVRGFICTTAHPAGCRAAVEEQIREVERFPHTGGPKKVLVIGASTGYGLASRISLAFGFGAATLGVSFEKPASGSRTATAGWYNTAAFEELARERGLYARDIMGDAFSREVKEQAAACIRAELGKVDMVVYSLAAPRRTLPDGTAVSSVLKTVGAPYSNKTIDLKTRTVRPVEVPPATEQEIADTVKVMGGEDWMDWMSFLQGEGLLAPGCIALAYSYLGPEVTHPMYLDGSIGQAKKHLKATADEMGRKLEGIKAYVSVNKALVTQSSAAIPIVPLYITMLYKVMKEMGLHEGCIQQMDRLFREKLFVPTPVVDEAGYLRPDDWEMRPDVQQKVDALWEKVDDANLEQLCDIDGYWEDFYHMFGFGFTGVDYEGDIDPDVSLPGLWKEE